MGNDERGTANDDYQWAQRERIRMSVERRRMLVECQRMERERRADAKGTRSCQRRYFYCIYFTIQLVYLSF